MRHKSDCRKGNHALGRRTEIGGGISRQVCRSCGYVEIDLRAEAAIEDSRLFATTRTDTIFAIQLALEIEFEPQQRSFGTRPERRSAPTNVF